MDESDPFLKKEENNDPTGREMTDQMLIADGLVN